MCLWGFRVLHFSCSVGNDPVRPKLINKSLHQLIQLFSAWFKASHCSVWTARRRAECTLKAAAVPDWITSCGLFNQTLIMDLNWIKGRQQIAFMNINLICAGELTQQKNTYWRHNHHNLYQNKITLSKIEKREKKWLLIVCCTVCWGWIFTCNFSCMLLFSSMGLGMVILISTPSQRKILLLKAYSFMAMEP